MQVKELREAMGYSIGEMAQILRLSKSTYQGYDTGRRKAPKCLTEQMRSIQAQDLAFLAGLSARVDAEIEKSHPNGLISEVVNDDWQQRS